MIPAQRTDSPLVPAQLPCRLCAGRMVILHVPVVDEHGAPQPEAVHRQLELAVRAHNRQHA